jgi:hypothetical protein
VLSFSFLRILGLPAIAFATQWYVDVNLRPFGLSLLGWDSCFFGLSFAVMFVLGATGFIALVSSLVVAVADKLRAIYPN